MTLQSVCCALCSLWLLLPGSFTLYAQPADVPRIITEDQLNDELLNGRRSFINVVILDRWHGSPLMLVNDSPVLFRQCHFMGGIELLNVRITVPLSFDCCAFGPAPHICNAKGAEAIHCPLPDFDPASLSPNNPLLQSMAEDNLIQSCFIAETIRFRSCSFSWDVRIFDTVFGGLFTSEDSCHERTLRIEQCSFGSRFRLARVKFHTAVVIEKSDFNNSVDVTESEFSDVLELQKAHISGDLILESSSLRSSGRGAAPGRAVLRMIDTIIAGELNADHFTFKTDSPKTHSRLVIQESTIGDIRGIDWEDFHRAFESADPDNEGEVLAQLRRSYLQFGRIRDAGDTLLAMKSNEAKNAGVFAVALNQIMLYSSGWGTQPWRLVGWFAALVGLFAIGYLILVVAHSAWTQIPSVLLECLTISISVTLLQYDPDDVEDLCRGKPLLLKRLRSLMRVHKIIAAVFLMVVAGYIGASLATS